MSTGKKIKELRETLSITQSELAKQIGTTKQTIYKYENDIVTNIPINKINQIATILNTTPAYLMGWDIEKEKINPSPNKLIYDILDNRSLSSNETHKKRLYGLINHFERLNVIGQIEAIKRVEELTYVSKYINKEKNT